MAVEMKQKAAAIIEENKQSSHEYCRKCEEDDDLSQSTGRARKLINEVHDSTHH